MYVYCVVRGEVSPRALRNVPALPEGKPPRVIALGERLSLIVADVPSASYAADEVAARLGDIDWVGRCGAAHHAVADALVGRHTVVPLRPFTLFASDARARTAFARRARQLDRALDRVQDRAEWVLRVGKPDPARVAAAASHDAKKPATGAAFLAQKAAARQRSWDIATRLRGDVTALYDSLAEVADESDRRGADGPAGLLLDAAFLVRSRRTASFKRTLETAARRLLEAGCPVSVTGPWPPYSFVSVETDQRE